MPKSKLLVAPSEIDGVGVHSLSFIRHGQLIRYYTGENISIEERKRRQILNMRNGMKKTYFFQLDEDRVVDATEKGNEARFINHSCTPNCEAVSTGSSQKRIAIYALENIQIGDELTIDYNFDQSAESKNRAECYCGSWICRKFLD